jgi:Tfp pilus assembly protein PilW
MMTQKGYSLNEILVVTVLSVVLIGAVLFIFTDSTNYLLHSDVMSTLQFDARFATRKLVSEIQRTNLGHVTISQSIPIIGDDSITYSLLGDQNADGVPDQTAAGDPDWSKAMNVTVTLDTNSHKLIRSTVNGDFVLAKNVKTINFMDHTTTPAMALNEVKIYIEFEKTVRGHTYAFNITSEVTMRN